MNTAEVVEKPRRGRKVGSKNKSKELVGEPVDPRMYAGVPSIKPPDEKREKLFAPTYKRIEVEIELTTRMYGGLPQTQEQLRAWIEAKGPIPEETFEDKLAVTPALTEEQITTKIEASSTVFRADEQGLFARDFMVKQMIKECATVLGLTVKKIGSKNILTIGMVVEPERIRPYIQRSEEFAKIMVDVQDGWEEFQGRVSGPQGKRNILSRKAYLEPGTKFAFTIEFLVTEKVTVDDLKILLTHAGKFVGFGSARSREAGKFKINRFDVM